MTSTLKGSAMPICEVDPRHGMVPFCAYNLTDPEGLALYREP